jgi:hypothetical protein
MTAAFALLQLEDVRRFLQELESSANLPQPVRDRALKARHNLEDAIDYFEKGSGGGLRKSTFEVPGALWNLMPNTSANNNNTT